MKKSFYPKLFLVGALLNVSGVQAEVSSFGGDAEQFVGDGDLVPPACSLDLPKVASAPFFVKWDCSDNLSPKDDLRSEIWIKPNGQTISRKVKDFLGFPAAIEVNEGLLKDLSETKATTSSKADTSSTGTDEQSSFETYFPLEVRLIVRDRGGASTISEVKSVLSGSSLSCDLSLKTESIAASGDSSGTPSLEASATGIEGANSGGGVQSLNEFAFSSCDIDEICKDEPKYSFSISSAGAFTLIGTDKSYSGKGELVEDTENAGTSSYTGTVSTKESGVLAIEATCK